MTTKLPVLTFHAIEDRPSVISISPEVFRRGLAKLYENGFQPLGLPEVVDYLRQGALFPDRSVVISFDDGFQSVYEEAFPVLQRFNMSATVFLTVGEKSTVKPNHPLPAMEGRPMLTWREIQEMQQNGIAFGAHTLTHPDLTRLSHEQIEAEVGDSKAIMEEALGTPVDCFAYPYGRYDPRCREIVQEHFVCACSDKLGLVTSCSDPYAFERADTYYLRTDRLFDVMLTGLFPWYVRARSIPRQIRRAVPFHLKR